MKKFISVVSLLLLISILTACGNAGDSNTVTDNNSVKSENGQEETTLDTNLRENTPDSLPADLDFGGQVIRILHREDTATWLPEIYVETEVGEIVSDTIYQRNKSVEERLNIVIESKAIPGDWDAKDAYLNTIRNSVTSGSDDYDLIGGYAYYMPMLAPEGMLYNLMSVNYLDPTSIWWNADSAKELTIDNKMYFITGDYSLSLLRMTFVLYFNKQLVEDYSIENLYQAVLDGNWTIDKLMDITKNVYSDINGDGTADKSDMYGYSTTTGNFVDAYWFAFNHPIVSKDSNDLPQLAYNTERMATMIDKIYGYFYDSGSAYPLTEYGSGDYNPQDDITDIFVGGRSIFMPQYLGFTDQLRTMENDYGILPYPKWTADQKGYYTTSQNGHTIFCIPTTCKILDAVGAAMEALCAESYRKLTPVYFEVVLKEKYSRDSESSQMLDIIRAGIKFDFGYSNGISLDYISNIFRDIITNKTNNFASTVESHLSKRQVMLDKLIEDYQSLS